jgi:hypothetical protein
MSAATTVPVTITPEAAARLAKLGLQAQLEQMVEHTRQTVPDLTRIDITYLDPYGTGMEPGIGIEAMIKRPFYPEDRIEEKWGRWAIEKFPPQVLEHLTFLLRFEDDHAG